eukprot:m.167109 g.167109  ORF g.167109 m.167109 type:complete len:90 (-) comp17764_c1_seq3:95-364(-)
MVMLACACDWPMFQWFSGTTVRSRDALAKMQARKRASQQNHAAEKAQDSSVFSRISKPGAATAARQGSAVRDKQGGGSGKGSVFARLQR